MSLYLFESERLGFRYWEMEDKDFYVAMCSNPQVMRYFPDVLSPEEGYQQMLYKDDQLRTKKYGFWAVELKHSGELIGQLGVQDVIPDVPFKPSIEIGWRLHEPFWRQGYAVEGAKRVIDYVKEHRITDTLVAYTAKINIPSQKVMKRLGMQFEGEFEHSELDPANPLCSHVWYRINL